MPPATTSWSRSAKSEARVASDLSPQANLFARPAVRPLGDRRQRSLGIDEGVRQPQLDEGLTRDADASGFSIDRAQQVDGEVDVDTLDFAARTTGF